MSLNCKEMNQKEKRDKIFNLLKMNHADIICLQETNTNFYTFNYLSNSWHMKALWNNYMAILINNIKIHSISFSSFLENRYLLCKFYINQKEFRIHNIYTPPDRKNRLTFWQKFTPNFIKSAHNIVVENFNTILDSDHDKISKV